MRTLQGKDHSRNAPESRKWYGEDPGPCLMLVADSGVYLISNGWPGIGPDGQVPHQASETSPYLVAYADGCDPSVDDFESWWHVHNSIFEGSDFSLPIELPLIDRALQAADRQIVVIIDKEGMMVLPDVVFQEVDILPTSHDVEFSDDDDGFSGERA